MAALRIARKKLALTALVVGLALVGMSGAAAAWRGAPRQQIVALVMMGLIGLAIMGGGAWMTWFGVTIILGVWRAIPREKRGALYLGLALGVVAVVSMVMAMGGPRHILQEAVRRVFTASGVPFTMPPAQGVKR